MIVSIDFATDIRVSFDLWLAALRSWLHPIRSGVPNASD